MISTAHIAKTGTHIKGTKKATATQQSSKQQFPLVKKPNHLIPTPLTGPAAENHDHQSRPQAVGFDQP